MQQVNVTMWKLNSYWKATEASNKWQLLIFDAVIKSKFLYGMETVQLTEAMINKLDAFQMKGIRKILGKKHTYWDRAATNESIVQTATRIVRAIKKSKNTRKEYAELLDREEQEKARSSEVTKPGNDWGVDDIMEDDGKNQKQIDYFSEAYRKRQLSLLGHVIRADNSDPMRQAAMQNGTIKGRKVKSWKTKA